MPLLWRVAQVGGRPHLKYRHPEWTIARYRDAFGLFGSQSTMAATSRARLRALTVERLRDARLGSPFGGSHGLQSDAWRSRREQFGDTMRGGDLQRELRAGGVRLGGCRELRGRSGGDLRICVPRRVPTPRRRGRRPARRRRRGAMTPGKHLGGSVRGGDVQRGDRADGVHSGAARLLRAERGSDISDGVPGRDDNHDGRSDRLRRDGSGAGVGAQHVSGDVGQTYSYMFVASGTPNPTYSLSGQPPWLTINATTGALSGVPPSGTKSFKYSVTASNGILPNASTATFTVTVSPAGQPPRTSESACRASSDHSGRPSESRRRPSPTPARTQRVT